MRPHEWVPAVTLGMRASCSRCGTQRSWSGVTYVQLSAERDEWRGASEDCDEELAVLVLSS